MLDIVSDKKEILLTIAAFVIILGLNTINERAIHRFGRLGSINMNSRRIVFYLSNLFFYGLGITVLTFIWGVDLRRLSIFLSSMMAVVGIGFVAQRYILSNLTASVIGFFNHPLRLGDKIRVMDKDFDWTGIFEDISGFYLFMRSDDDKHISLRKNLVIQKGIKILAYKTDKENPSEKVEEWKIENYYAINRINSKF
ncbi:MAG: mechanosensitive ion channel protein MscS [Bacteroidota bacterium]